MSTLSLRLPKYLHEQVRALSAAENVSINQFITLALAEKISALVTEQYLGNRGTQGERARFEAAMDKVAEVEPEAYDALENKRGEA
jgi:hypothetical protein